MDIREGDNIVWQTPKTNWDTHPKAIEPSDMNRIEGNILAVREQINIPLRAEVVDSFPPHAEGRIIYHTGHKRAYVSDGSAWVAVNIEGDADVGHVLAGKTFSSRVAGVGAVGTMPNRGAVVITPGTSNKAIPAGFHNGQGYVKGDSKLVSKNIVEGISIFGVNGSAKKVVTGSFSIQNETKNIQIGFKAKLVLCHGIPGGRYYWAVAFFDHYDNFVNRSDTSYFYISSISSSYFTLTFTKDEYFSVTYWAFGY